MSPRSCRTLRGLHDGTPKQRCARRVFVEVGNRASALRAAARFPRCAGLRRLTLRVRCNATVAVSDLRKSGPYASA